MSETSDIQSSVERMNQHMELRGLRPNTVRTCWEPRRAPSWAESHMSDQARCPSGVVVARPALEVADILRRHMDDYRQHHALTEGQERVVGALLACRTAALGGHLDRCTECGFEQPAYNSCRNRHCPKCQALEQARWVEARLDRILPVHCFHLVFTLPSELHSLAYSNPREIFALLFRSAADALLTLAADPKWLGQAAKPGITAVLHSRSRDLRFHPHVHCIVTGGGLANDQSRWVSAARNFLFPVHVIGKLFRGKFMAGLQELLAGGKLPGSRLGGRLEVASVVKPAHHRLT
jgi:predicted Zn-ribbon and HTH transcriptional regulator